MPKARVIAFLLIFGGAVFGVLGGLHAIYTVLDLRNPQRLVPADPSVARAMADSSLRLSGKKNLKVYMMSIAIAASPFPT